MAVPLRRPYEWEFPGNRKEYEAVREAWEKAKADFMADPSATMKWMQTEIHKVQTTALTVTPKGMSGEIGVWVLYTANGGDYLSHRPILNAKMPWTKSGNEFNTTPATWSLGDEKEQVPAWMWLLREFP